MLAGRNGQGKTNVLEAAYMLLARRSFRATRLQELIRFQRATARLRGEVELLGLRSEVAIEISAKRKQITLDGKLLRSEKEQEGGLGAVVFSPDDLSIPKGSPSQRRRLLDGAVAVGWSGYVQLYREYQKTLATRNKVLKERTKTLDALLDVYDQQLAALAAKVIIARRRYVRVISPLFTEIFGKIMGPKHHATLRTVESEQQRVETIADTAKDLLRQLGARRNVDKIRRSTSVGPHTHDLELILDGRDARHFASQGQTRALILAFKIAQILDTYQRWQHYPLLLLDDVSSELDPERETFLFNFIKEISCQTLITTTRPELIPVEGNRRDFKVMGGKIAQQFP